MCERADSWRTGAGDDVDERKSTIFDRAAAGRIEQGVPERTGLDLTDIVVFVGLQQLERGHQAAIGRREDVPKEPDENDGRGDELARLDDRIAELDARRELPQLGQGQVAADASAPSVDPAGRGETRGSTTPSDETDCASGLYKPASRQTRSTRAPSPTSAKHTSRQ